MKTHIDSIIVSDRRREDLGDVPGLAASIKKYGLIHPVVIDSKKNLIVGERRLRACQMLGWEEIEARDFGELSEAERREIELEENLRRKDLTAIERSRDMVRKAEQIAPVISCNMQEKDTRGRKSEYGVPKEDIAQSIGVDEATLIRAEQHVAAVEKHPDLAPLPQSTAINEAKKRDEVSQPCQGRPIDTSRTWLKNLYPFRNAFAEIEGGGGIGRIARSWSPEGHREIVKEITRIRDEFNRWLDILDESRKTS